jgi:3-hydroxymyristoyl/3-hydroxydecanoyl-(acyl carrier protein) dehydratase
MSAETCGADTFVVAHDHPCLPGHFPGRPVVPGVVILDHVLAAIERVHGPCAALHWPQVKFVRPLLPGETATIVLEGAVDGALRWKFRVLRDGAPIASGEVRAG